MTEHLPIIDRNSFDENLQMFDNETILEIIDIFLQEIPGRLDKLTLSISQHDFDALRFNAHSTKGVVAVFGASGPYEVIQKIEEDARANEAGNLSRWLEEFKALIDGMVEELSALRKEYI